MLLLVRQWTGHESQPVEVGGSPRMPVDPEIQALLILCRVDHDRSAVLGEIKGCCPEILPDP